MPASSRLIYHHDPGHGWLAVPLGKLRGFKPSEFSFYDQRFAYLEEDCDAPGWLRHVGMSFNASAIVDKQHDSDAFLANTRRFPATVEAR